MERECAAEYERQFAHPDVVPDGPVHFVESIQRPKKCDQIGAHRVPLGPLVDVVARQDSA